VTAGAPATPRASVVVATYNRLSAVRRLLEQLDRQTLAAGSYEVIVVDDGSAVDVRPHVSPHDYSFPLRVERQANAGPAAARQRGADSASGEILVFVDDDMEVPPQFLEAHLASHASKEKLVVIGCLRAGRPFRQAPLVERYRLGISERLLKEVEAGRVEIAGKHVYTGNLSLAAHLFREVGGFDPDLRFLEDVDFGIRLQDAGARFVLSDQAWSAQSRDPMSSEQWFARSLHDGAYQSRVARKHPGMPDASPWHFIDLANPFSRPLLTLSAVAPAPAAVLARSAFATASLANALGFERVAIAGATFVYGVNMFRGVGREAGGARATLQEYREFRRGLRELRSGSRSRFRDLVEAIEEDYRVLEHNIERYDARQPELGSPAAAYVRNMGFQVVVGYRVMRYMRSLELPLATRVVARTMRHVYGSDVHWDAELAPGLMVVHGFGLAVSYAARTAHGCVLSQNVTLGVGHDAATGASGGPDLRQDVVVGPGATLIGPIVIGGGSKIMAGCVVHQSVPARTIVEAPAPTLRPRSGASPAGSPPLE
jgi:serine acetyltransferase/GT2 family glycosyltransferase